LPIHSIKGVWNLGGDLRVFCQLHQEARIKLHLPITHINALNLVYNYNSNYDLDVFSTCVVQGNAFGGGFESALIWQLYYWRKNLLNLVFLRSFLVLFQEWGPTAFLTKKVGFNKANEIINSNKTYTSQDIFELGIINKVCDDGMGIATMSSC
jgi:DSF synthase